MAYRSPSSRDLGVLNARLDARNLDLRQQLATELSQLIPNDLRSLLCATERTVKRAPSDDIAGAEQSGVRSRIGLIAFLPTSRNPDLLRRLRNRHAARRRRKRRNIQNSRIVQQRVD